MSYIKCPICDGRGHQRYGFYFDEQVELDDPGRTTKCRTCSGTGLLKPEDIKDGIDINWRSPLPGAQPAPEMVETAQQKPRVLES